MSNVAHSQEADAPTPTPASAPALMFRAPSTTSAKSPAAFEPPSGEFLHDKWHVTHSTLPMWKSNRNVTITYTPLNDPPGAIDDLVEYQPLNSEKQKTVRGVDTPHESVSAAFQWRGRGWLKIASSKWEVIGYGSEEGGWAVTYFAKTMFTPAGIDVYARSSGGLSVGLLDRIRAEMKKVDDGDFQAMADKIFEIKHDG